MSPFKLIPQSFIEVLYLFEYPMLLLTSVLGRLFLIFLFFFFILLYNIILVLPYINMHLPRVYMCSYFSFSSEE